MPPPGCHLTTSHQLPINYSGGTYVQDNRGGILLLIKNNLNPIIFTEADVEAEILWVTLNLHPRLSWLVGVCYRPEKDEQFMLSKICSSINKINNVNCVLLGDFNFRKINWSTLTGTSQLENQFIDTIADNLLNQVVPTPTRENNILDLVLINDPTQISDLQVHEPFGSSDHNMIYFDLQCPIPRISRAERKVYLYSQGDYDTLNSKISLINWESKFHGMSVHRCWDIFKEQYNYLIEEHIPHKLVKPGARNGPPPPWTRYKSIKKAKRQRRKKWVSYRKSQLESDKLLYEQENVNVIHSLSTAKAHYENKLIDQIKEDPKRFWNYTRHFSRSSSTIDMLVHEGEKITDDSAKAKILNEYFISVLTQEPEILGSLPEVVDAKPQNLLEDFTILQDTIRKKLTRLKANKASGPDQISINVLRNCPNFSIPLTILFNNSIQSGSLPQDWRDAYMFPLFIKKVLKPKVVNIDWYHSPAK